MGLIHINLNECVKFKLTDHGKDIFYHRFDGLNESIIRRGLKPIAPKMPKTDADGYTRMQLWEFMELYGPHIGMAKESCIESLEIIYESKDCQTKTE